MRATIIAFGTILASASTSSAMPVAPLSAPPNAIQVHGCHHYYAQDISGWHRHDQSCNTLRGVVGRKNRNPVRS